MPVLPKHPLCLRAFVARTQLTSYPHHVHRNFFASASHNLRHLAHAARSLRRSARHVARLRRRGIFPRRCAHAPGPRLAIPVARGRAQCELAQNLHHHEPRPAPARARFARDDLQGNFAWHARHPDRRSAAESAIRFHHAFWPRVHGVFRWTRRRRSAAPV